MLLNEGASLGRSTTIVSLVLLHYRAGFRRSRTTPDLEEKMTKEKGTHPFGDEGSPSSKKAAIQAVYYDHHRILTPLLHFVIFNNRLE